MTDIKKKRKLTPTEALAAIEAIAQIGLNYVKKDVDTGDYEAHHYENMLETYKRASKTLRNIHSPNAGDNVVSISFPKKP